MKIKIKDLVLIFIFILLLCVMLFYTNQSMADNTANGYFYKLDYLEGSGSASEAQTAVNTFNAKLDTADAAIKTNLDHASADGSSHTYIDQDVTSGSSPTFTGTNISGIDDDNVNFDDADSVWTATTIGAALEELNDTGTINSATSKVNWTQLTGVPSDFADGTDDSGSGTPGGSNTQVQYNNSSSFGGISGLTTDGTNVTLTGSLDAGVATGLEIPNSTALNLTTLGQIGIDTDADNSNITHDVLTYTDGTDTWYVPATRELPTTNQQVPTYNSTNKDWEYGVPSGSGAPTDAKYITQTANGTLSAEQALSSLSSGIMRVATTTGVVTSLTDSSGIASNISDETGTGVLVFGTQPTIVLKQGTEPTPTSEGAIEWETDDDHIIVGDGSAQVEFVPAEDVSGDATMTDAGVVTVVDDSHNHVITNIDSFTKAQLETQTSDVSDYAEADGDVYTGTHDFGGADHTELPNSATYSPGTTTGRLGLDTTITNYDGLWRYYDGAVEMVIVAMPAADLTTTDNDVVAYASGKSGFNMEAQAEGEGGGASELSLDMRPHQVKFPDANMMATDSSEEYWSLVSDADTEDTAYFQTVIDDDFGGGTLYADVFYTMTSATSGSIVMCMDVDAISVGDSNDFGDTPTWGGRNSTTDVVPGTAGHLGSLTITLTNRDSLAAGDLVMFALIHDSDDSSDTATGNTEIRHVQIRE